MRRRWLPVLALVSVPALAQETASPGGKALFQGYCGSCHSIDLPQSQQLDRANWEWVLEDMVEKYKCSMTPEQQAQILDYLVEHHGTASASTTQRR